MKIMLTTQREVRRAFWDDLAALEGIAPATALVVIGQAEENENAILLRNYVPKHGENAADELHRIVAACNAFPALLSEVRRLRDEKEELVANLREDVRRLGAQSPDEEDSPRIAAKRALLVKLGET